RQERLVQRLGNRIHRGNSMGLARSDSRARRIGRLSRSADESQVPSKASRAGCLTPSESDTGSDGSAQSWAWCLTPAGCLTPLESDTGSAQSWGWCLTPAGEVTPKSWISTLGLFHGEVQ